MILQRRRSNSFLIFFLVLTTLCSVLFTIYIIYFSTLPKIPRRNSSPRLPNISNKGCTSSSNSEASIPNANYVPIMNLRKRLGKNKKKVMLLIIVSTAPARVERRQAIRTTWWKHCIDDKVKCVFVTDGFIVDEIQRELTIQERNRYNDMELQPLMGGREFGLRFLNQIKWAHANFDFQFLLRIDDDYFLCLRRLLSELPMRPKKNLVWGFFHCARTTQISWIDEAFMIFTADIIDRFLSQNESVLLCHPHADQQIAIWLAKIPRKLYFHDKRLYHDPPASFSRKFDNIKNICDSYIGVHGTYADKMKYFGQNANDGKKTVADIPKFSRFCPTTRFDYRLMDVRFLFHPKPCKDNPTWNVERTMFIGRENN